MIKSLFGLSSREKEVKPKAAVESPDEEEESSTALSNPERRTKRQKGPDDGSPLVDENQEEEDVAVEEKQNDDDKHEEEDNAVDVKAKQQEEDDGKHNREDDAAEKKQQEDEDGMDISEDEEDGDDIDGNATPSEATNSNSKPPATPEEDDDEDDSHPYIGKNVKIMHGPGKGTVGKLTALRSRGWWTLDNREGVVHSRRCQLLDNVNEEDMVAYYEKRGKKYRGTPVLDKKSKLNGSSSKGAAGAQKEMKEGGAAHRTMRALDNSNNKLKLHAPLLMSDLLEGASQPHSKRVYCDEATKLQAKLTPWVLPPIVLEGDGTGGDGIPSALQHLDPKQLLEVFDRKLGIILRDRIAVEDLPQVLKEHAEYEPIVPPRDDNDEEIYVRQGRSGANLQVSDKVRPQPKRRWNGKKVVVTSGSYRGKEGRIQSSLPGGWYLVAGILEEIDVVLSPGCVEEKEESSEFTSDEETEDTEEGRGLPQQNGNRDKKPSRDDTKEIASLRTTFNEALGATIQSESTVSKTQVDALREDQRNLERQLVETDANDPVAKRLVKRLDYVKACLKKAEQDCETEEESAKTTQVVAEKVFTAEQVLSEPIFNGAAEQAGAQTVFFVGAEQVGAEKVLNNGAAEQVGAETIFNVAAEAQHDQAFSVEIGNDAENQVMEIDIE